MWQQLARGGGEHEREEGEWRNQEADKSLEQRKTVNTRADNYHK